MKKIPLLFAFILIVILHTHGKTDGTTGIPLGGIGTGAIKYNASKGSFSGSFNTPTRDGNYQQLASTHFQFFSDRGGNVITRDVLKAYTTDGRVDDDAVFPIHRINYGIINNVAVQMTAYMSYSPSSIEVMSHPVVIYEFTLENKENTAVSSAIALQLKTQGVPVAKPDSGFAYEGSSLQMALLGTINDNNGTLTYGSDNSFFTNGLCNNTIDGSTNRVALKVDLEANTTKTLRFALSWYKADDLEHYYYANFWKGAWEVAKSANTNFNTFKAHSEKLVNVMRNTNLPNWLIDQTLNSTANLVNNSIFFKDGRYCHSEGQWEPEGTMDQMWHSRQIYTMINPELAWMELEWWARTQHVSKFAGQIHHDFGTHYEYVSWDDTEHDDYRNIDKWVDLNCGFILSVYETFIATADQDKLTYFWPYVEKAGQRILDQVRLYGSNEFPYTFDDAESTYDAGGNSQAYNSGLSIVAYKMMMYMAEIMDENALISTYSEAAETAIVNFEKRWLDQPYPQGNFCESGLAAPWITNYMKLDPFWDQQKMDNLYITILNYYDPINQGMGLVGGSYSEWQPYLISHLGGYALQTNRPDVWVALQKDMYERSYLNRNLVFNTELGIPQKVTTPTYIATSTDASDQYISIPVIWRNYYNMAGYHYNKFSGELWIEPSLFDTLTTLNNIPIITPEGYVYISYETSGDLNQNQKISFTPEQNVSVNAIYVWDKYSDEDTGVESVKVNGADVVYSRTGKGQARHLKLDYSSNLSPEGIVIEIKGTGKTSTGTVPDAPTGLMGVALSSCQLQLEWHKEKGDILGYILEIEKDGNYETLITTAPSDSLFLETGLQAESTYNYQIRSYNSFGISDPSNPILVETYGSGNGDVIKALNLGGDAYTSSSGVEYIASSGSGWVSGGSEYSSTSSISGTDDPVLYQTEMYGDYTCNIPIDNGMYYVVLKFAEVYHADARSRVFDVLIEGKTELENFDIAFRSGKDIAYDVHIPVEVSDGKLTVKLITINDNAKLSALEIKSQFSIGVDEVTTGKKASLFVQNYPNPTAKHSTINYRISTSGHVNLSLFNLHGEKVSELVNNKMEVGEYEVGFDVGDLLPGTYFYQLTFDGHKEIRKMIVME